MIQSQALPEESETDTKIRHRDQNGFSTTIALFGIASKPAPARVMLTLYCSDGVSSRLFSTAALSARRGALLQYQRSVAVSSIGFQ